MSFHAYFIPRKCELESLVLPLRISSPMIQQAAVTGVGVIVFWVAWLMVRVERTIAREWEYRLRAATARNVESIGEREQVTQTPPSCSAWWSLWSPLLPKANLTTFFLFPLPFSALLEYDNQCSGIQHWNGTQHFSQPILERPTNSIHTLYLSPADLCPKRTRQGRPSRYHLPTFAFNSTIVIDSPLALLHSIFFHRLLVNVAPRELRFLDTTVVRIYHPSFEYSPFQASSHATLGSHAAIENLGNNW